MVQIPQGVAEDACTLPSAERTLREQEFDQLVTVAVWAWSGSVPHGLRMALDATNGRGPHSRPRRRTGDRPGG